MPFSYLPPPSDGSLRQGEILSGIIEHRAVICAQPLEERNVPVESIPHHLAVILSADCDLEQDFNTRFLRKSLADGSQSTSVDESDHHLFPYIAVCDLFPPSHVRGRFNHKELWKRVVQNQDERYHHFVDQGCNIQSLSDVYIDFKKAFALPIMAVYRSIIDKQVQRVALVPEIYLHDLMHRYYSFLSRIAVPD